VEGRGYISVGCIVLVFARSTLESQSLDGDMSRSENRVRLSAG
jgi:hypothetical protein